MKSKQVLSIEQMKHLQELGLDTSDASVIKYNVSETETYCGYSREIITIDGLIDDYISKEHLYSLADMLEMMPNTIEVNESECNLCLFFHEDGISIYYEDNYDEQPAFFCEDSLLESAYKMLCWVIENGYIKKEEE